MSKYFYSDGSNQHGPFTLDELKTKPITPSTLVWYDGLPSWVAASSLPELSSIISSSTPPPITPPPVSVSGTSNKVAPKNWLIESILATLFCCIPFGVIGIINAIKVEKLFNEGKFAESEKASNDAKTWTIVSVIIGLAVTGLYLIAAIAEQ